MVEPILRNRATFMDPGTAKVLFERLSPFLQFVHYHDQTSSSTSHLLGPKIPSGAYIPVAVNEFMRISKYAPQGQFRQHFDTGYVRDKSSAGFWTLLLYLNEEFVGGETVLYDKKQQRQMGSEVLRVQPKVGQVFAFYHYQRHAGLKVASGDAKICLRTEIMFSLQERKNWELRCEVVESVCRFNMICILLVVSPEYQSPL